MKTIKIKIGFNRFVENDEKDLSIIHAFYFIANNTIYLSTHEFLTIPILIHEIMHKILYEEVEEHELMAFDITSKWDNIDDPFNGLNILNFPSNPGGLICDE